MEREREYQDKMLDQDQEYQDKDAYKNELRTALQELRDNIDRVTTIIDRCSF